MIKKARTMHVLIFIIFISASIFVGCSTIPLEEGSQAEVEIEVTYNLIAEGTSADGLGIRFSWDQIDGARLYRLLFDVNGTTLVDTVFAAFEVDSAGDTAYNNFFVHENITQLGDYKVQFSTSSSGGSWQNIDSASTVTESGASYLVSYDCAGPFAMYWDTAGFEIIGRENMSLHSVAEIYLYDPCDSAWRIDTTLFVIDTTVTAIDTTIVIDTLVVPPETTVVIDTTFAYDTTITEDSATAFIQFNTGITPPLLGANQSGVVNAGTDSTWSNLTVARLGDEYGTSALISLNDIFWLQSSDGRYMKLRIDSMYIAPVTSDLDTAIVYFTYRYQLIPNFRYVY